MHTSTQAIGGRVTVTIIRVRLGACEVLAGAPTLGGTAKGMFLEATSYKPRSEELIRITWTKHMGQYIGQKK